MKFENILEAIGRTPCKNKQGGEGNEVHGLGKVRIPKPRRLP